MTLSRRLIPDFYLVLFCSIRLAPSSQRVSVLMQLYSLVALLVLVISPGLAGYLLWQDWWEVWLTYHDDVDDDAEDDEIHDHIADYMYVGELCI